MTVQVLSRMGFTVLQAATGAEAIALAAAFPESIDLLVTDVVMPRMNGRALAATLRRHRPGLRVLLMSGWTDDGSVDLGKPDPATPFLEKPFTPQALARKVRDVIDGPPPPRDGPYESDPPDR